MSTILLKRSLNTAIPASLANGESAYTANGDIFYIGSNGAIVAIGGKRVPGVLTANQAVVTNSTNMIDQMLFGNSTVNAAINSLAFTLANSTVTFSLTKPTAAQVTSGNYFPNSGGGWSQVTGGTTNPAGSNTNIQFNDSGSFGADALLVWNKIAEALMVGNSTINVVANSSTISINGGAIIANVSGFYAGANVGLDTVKGSWGNSTVNTVVNSVGISINGGAASLTATTVTAGLLGGNQINATANISFTGANVSLPNANLSVKDLNLSGNLTVLGTVTTIDATNLQVKDSMIKLADQNAADTIDEGFYAVYNDGSTRYRGLVYDASNGNFMLFSNTLAEPTTTLDTSNTSLAVATLRAYLTSGNLISNSTGVFIGANSTYAVQLVANSITLTTPLAGTSGGTGKATVGSLSLLTGNTTNGYNELTFSATDGAILQGNTTALRWDPVIDCGTF